MGFSEKQRLAVLKRAHFTCCLCKVVGPIEIHHIQPESEGGPDVEENAAPLCPTCHETYGANPTKRKLIRETRNHWYDVCVKRYTSGSDQLQELVELVKKIDSRVSSIEQELVAELHSPEPGSSRKFLPLAAVVEYLIKQRFDGDEAFEKSLEMTYQLLFKTNGDTNSDFDREFNETRDAFLIQFGVILAEAVCAKENRHSKIDWTKGVAEEEVNPVYHHVFIMMVLVLHHEDLGKEFKLRASLDPDGEIRFTAVNSSPLVNQ